LSSEIDEKLIELLRKHEELYDIANKKYSDFLEGKIVGTIVNFSSFTILVTVSVFL
jgi:hypothetical protein